MKKNPLITTLALLAVIAVGCSVGDAPKGSPEQALKEYDALPPDQKISFIQNSPMPAEEKKRRIEEIQKKAGMTVDTSSVNSAPPGSR